MKHICEFYGRIVDKDCIDCQYSSIEGCPFIHNFKAGDVLVNKSHHEDSITIIDIVGDQYKYECGDEYPHYEFLVVLTLITNSKIVKISKSFTVRS